MTSRTPSRRDLSAFALAAIGTLATSFLNGPFESGPIESNTATPDIEVMHSDPALDGLLDPKTAQSEGAWWIGEPAANARLSYAPEHDRLVWRVSGATRGVLLDAATGEALAFEY